MAHLIQSLRPFAALLPLFSLAGHCLADAVRPESLAQGFVIILIDESGKASEAGLAVHMPGSHNGWDPSNPAFALEHVGDNRWRIEHPQPVGHDRIEFKFALGDWGHGECDADGGETPNRTLPMVEADDYADGSKPVFEISVPNFRDGAEAQPFARALDPDREMDVVGEIDRFTLVGGGGEAGALERTIFVWLPPGYHDEPDRAYPVLYMMDAQNLFEHHGWLPGEWKVDETATALIEAGEIPPMLIVGLPHADRLRMSEYLPLPVFDTIEPGGPEFVEWLVASVMPEIRSRYRVQTGRAHTSIGGSSMGAMISMYASLARPDVFGMVLAESFPLLAGPEKWDAFFDQAETWPDKIYLGVSEFEVGLNEVDHARNNLFIQKVRELDERLAGQGLGPDRRRLVIGEGHIHNEVAWAERLPDAMRFLFGSP